MRSAVAALLLISACAPCHDSGPGIEIDPPPDAELAVEMVAELYAGDHVHDVRWVRPAPAAPAGLTISSEGCCHSRVAWDGRQPLASTSLAHEMAHCELWARTGDVDEEHRSRRWFAAGGLVAQADQLLLEAGL